MQWYYAINGQRQGPVSQSDFDKLAATGAIVADTLVWQQAMPDWLPYAKIVGAPPLVAAQPGTGDETEICVVSGLRHPRREMIQYEGKWISAARRDEFFQRLREGVTAPNDIVYGNFWPRFCAKFIDGLITGLVGVGINMAVAFALFGSPNYFGTALQKVGLQRMLLFQAITMLLGIVVGVGYTWFFVSRYQATPGKMTFSLKIVRADGSRLSNGRIVGRYFAELISTFTLLIGYIMAAFDDQRRALHDRICDTRVIKTK